MSAERRSDRPLYRDPPAVWSSRPSLARLPQPLPFRRLPRWLRLRTLLLIFRLLLQCFSGTKCFFENFTYAWMMQHGINKVWLRSFNNNFLKFLFVLSRLDGFDDYRHYDPVSLVVSLLDSTLCIIHFHLRKRQQKSLKSSRREST